MSDNTTDSAHYSEVYSAKERRRFIVLGLGIGIPLIVGFQYYIFPWMRGLATTFRCSDVAFGLNGIEVTLWGSLVGIPVLSGFLMICVFGVEAYRILREQQYPLKGQKTMRPIKVRYGSHAKLYAYTRLLVCGLFFAIAIFGAFQAEQLVQKLFLERCQGQ